MVLMRLGWLGIWVTVQYMYTPMKLVQAGHTFVIRERRRRGAAIVKTVTMAEVDHCPVASTQ